MPFCAARCDYCAFATWADRDHLMGRYVAACHAELARARDAGELPRPATVFVGGGTPSRLAAEDLAGLIVALDPLPGAEVTVECNPEDAGEDRFAVWRQAGVTRVSFGVQSTRAHVLAGLGRRHDPASVDRALELARGAGFASVNADLIFGGAGESDADWAATLESVTSHRFAPDHVSAYALTVEPGTPLARDPGRHPDDDVQARRYERADEHLAAAGYRWYEISNWARPGHACRHNLHTWRQGDYRGLGAAAHSHGAGRRWWNVRRPERYVEAVEAGRSPVAGEEVLDAAGRSFEALALALRTAEGVPAAALPGCAESGGLVEVRGSRAVLTLRGRLLANTVTQQLLLPADAPRREPVDQPVSSPGCPVPPT